MSQVSTTTTSKRGTKRRVTRGRLRSTTKRKIAGSKGSTAVRTTEHAHIEQNGKVTHVLVPVDEYERLIATSMAEQAVARLEDDKTEWVDADAVARELARDRIVSTRKAAGLTQKQLGDKLGLPQSQISRIERQPDRTTVRTLKRVARALGVDVGALL